MTPERRPRSITKKWQVLRTPLCVSILLLGGLIAVLATSTIPTDIKAPGTQPGEVLSFTSPDNCDNCHGGTVNPNYEPAFGWRGGMMANAGRDPIFWATLAVAEQDFVPGSNPAARGGAGDLCLRCHAVNGWISGRSTPTDGSGLSTQADTNGVECEFCHLMVDPDAPTSISGTTEVQNSPFQAYDATYTYRGAAEYVLNGNGTRLGPFSDANAKHSFLPSPFHRKADLCATCHDVSNPAVGDLAPNNGAQVPLLPGTFSGVLGSAVDLRAAFNNPPFKFGVVERTFSEWFSSALSTLPVNSYPALPADLRVAGGSLDTAYHRAYDARSTANYEDGTARLFTCQTCHMSASTGVGCNKAGTPTRTDLPRHDQTGSGYWMPDVVQYMDTKGTLRLGGGLTQVQKDALNAGKLRAQQMLQSAATVSAQQSGADLVVRVTNLTAHKLISGYPEGRRAWINVRWYDAGDNLVQEDGAYGPIGRSVADSAGVQHPVQSLLNPAGTVVYEAEMGLDQAWAQKLVSTYGYSGSLPLDYDRLTDAPVHTLGQLSSSAPGTQFRSFHFVLNNVVVSDNRIPPYGFRYDDARLRNALPVPSSQFGDPGPGGTYNYWDERHFTIPAYAVSAQVRLYYQQTSWEYVQFVWKQNDRLNTFLSNEGVNFLDGWLNNGECPPLQLALTAVSGLIPPVASAPGEASHENIVAEHLKAVYDSASGRIDITYTPACGATGHAIYYGHLDSVAAYGYLNNVCTSDTSGSVSLTPAEPDLFFLIVGNNGAVEGSYGKDSSGNQRPEGIGLTGCDYPQSLTGTCDPP
jgi:hypothetical protein